MAHVKYLDATMFSHHLQKHLGELYVLVSLVQQTRILIKHFLKKEIYIEMVTEFWRQDSTKLVLYMYIQH